MPRRIRRDVVACHRHNDAEMAGLVPMRGVAKGHKVEIAGPEIRSPIRAQRSKKSWEGSQLKADKATPTTRRYRSSSQPCCLARGLRFHHRWEACSRDCFGV